MKQRIWTVERVLICLLGAGLILSLAGNAALYAKLNGQGELHIKGTYQLGESPYAAYLVLDGDGHFCTYTQEAGVLDSGVCQSEGDGAYTLAAEDGDGYCALRTPEGVYLFDAGENTLRAYTKLSDALVLYDIPGQWPDWCRTGGA